MQVGKYAEKGPQPPPMRQKFQAKEPQGARVSISLGQLLAIVAVIALRRLKADQSTLIEVVTYWSSQKVSNMQLPFLLGTQR